MRMVHMRVSWYTASNPWFTDWANRAANSWLLKIFRLQPERKREAHTWALLYMTHRMYIHTANQNVQMNWLTGRNLTHGGGVPAVTLVTVWTLNENSAVAQTLRKHFASDVIQAHTSACGMRRVEVSELACLLLFLNVFPTTYRCVCAWAPQLRCGSRWTTGPGRTARRSRGPWSRLPSETVEMRETSLPRAGSARSRRWSTRTQIHSMLPVPSLTHTQENTEKGSREISPEQNRKTHWTLV